MEENEETGKSNLQEVTRSNAVDLAIGFNNTQLPMGSKFRMSINVRDWYRKVAREKHHSQLSGKSNARSDTGARGNECSQFWHSREVPSSCEKFCYGEMWYELGSK